MSEGIPVPPAALWPGDSGLVLILRVVAAAVMLPGPAAGAEPAAVAGEEPGGPAAPCGLVLATGMVAAAVTLPGPAAGAEPVAVAGEEPGVAAAASGLAGGLLQAAEGSLSGMADCRSRKLDVCQGAQCLRPAVIWAGVKASCRLL